MKKQKITFYVLIFLSITTFSQVTGIGSASTSYEMVFVPGEKVDNSAAFKKIAPKMYLSTAYLDAKLSGINDVFFLRYNMYRDEMEFTKDGKTLYISKQPGRKIVFKDSKEKYIILNYNDKPRYFITHNEGDNILLTRKVVEYIEPKPANSSYQNDRPADFKRKNDENYIRFKDGSIIELPRNKKKFYNLFKDKSSDIKKYIKKEKLDIKEIEDLEKIVRYYNTL